MKSPRSFTFFSLLALSLTPLAARADIAADMIKEARAAIQRGDLNLAKAKLETVRGVDPKNPIAISLLQQVQTQQALQGGAGTEATLASLILPKVEFREATLEAALGALRQQAEKVSEGKVVPNFVTQLPGDPAERQVTLALRNVPFTEVLKYIGQLASVSFTYDKYAIVVRPAGAAN